MKSSLGKAVSQPLVRLQGITKSFGHVQALRGVDIEVHAGEVVGIAGDNGSGKSTLMNILSGVLAPDEGSIAIQGQQFPYLTTMQTLSMGIATVFQDLALDTLRDATANIFLGQEKKRLGVLLDRKAMREEARQLLQDLHIDLPFMDTPVCNLSGGQRQAVAVARALHRGKQLIIFDEPTAAMGLKESITTLQRIAQLAERGLGVIVICHNIPHLVGIATRIYVMRHGAVAQHFTGDFSLQHVQALLLEGAKDLPNYVR